MISLVLLYLTGSFPIPSTSSIHHAAIAVKESYSNSEPIIEDTDNFNDLVRYSDIFIDKSLLIEKFLTCKDQHILITSPPRWGKTVNLHMLESFLRPEMDENGKKVELSKNYRLFKHGEIIQDNGEIQRLKKPLLISTYQNLFDTYQGTYPVIYISLRGFKGSTYDELFACFADMIYEMMQQHDYVLDYLHEFIKNESNPYGDRANAEFDFADFNNMLNRSALADALIRSVDSLSQRLFEIHKKKVFVILDHYDDIFTKLITHNLESEHEEDFLSALRSFIYYCFKLNNFLEKGIIAGNVHILNILADRLVVKEHSLFVNNSIHFFGFKHEEVELLFDELAIPKNLREQTPQWYGGYHTHFGQNIQFYSTGSVIQMVKNKQINTYIEYKDNEFYIQNIVRSQHIRDILLSVIDGATESIKLAELHFNRATLKTLKKFNNPSSTNKTTYHMVTSALTYLSILGYFTTISKSVQVAIVRPPNNEARIDLANQLMDYYQHEYNISTTTIDTCVQHLLDYVNSEERKNQHFETALQRLVDNFPINYHYLARHGDDARTVEQQRELTMRFLFHYLASRIALCGDYRLQLPCEGVQCDIILYTENRGVLLEVKFSVSAPNQLLRVMNESRTVLEKMPGIKSMKLIGINVQKDKQLNADAIYEKLGGQ